jgi:hypothetical protein
MWAKLLDLQNRLNAVSARTPARVWRTTQQANFTSTTPVAITWQGFYGGDATGIPVLSGASYCVKGFLAAAMGSPNQNVYTRFTGPAFASGQLGFQCIEGTTVYTSGTQDTINSDCPINMVAATVGEFKFEGVVSFSAAGTFSMSGRISSTTPWAVQGGSYLEISQVA